MPQQPALRSLGEPALKKPRRCGEGRWLGGKGRAREEAKPALSAVPRQKGQGQKRIGPAGGEAKGPGAEGQGAPKHGLAGHWAIMHAGEGVAEEDHHGPAPKGAEERSALPGSLKHGEREAQGPGRGFEAGPFLGLAPGSKHGDSPVGAKGGPKAQEQTQIVRFVKHPEYDAPAFPGQGGAKACPFRGAKGRRR